MTDGLTHIADDMRHPDDPEDLPVGWIYLGWMCPHGRGHKQWSWSSDTVYDRRKCPDCFPVYRPPIAEDGA